MNATQRYIKHHTQYPTAWENPPQQNTTQTYKT